MIVIMLHENQMPVLVVKTAMQAVSYCGAALSRDLRQPINKLVTVDNVKDNVEEIECTRSP